MEKLVVDGKVAVLVSFGYGAGWSTWGGEDSEKKLFDPVLAQMILDNNHEITANIVRYVEETYPDSYNGGLPDVEVVFLNQGTRFFIDEYDGAESIETEDDIKWEVA